MTSVSHFLGKKQPVLEGTQERRYPKWQKTGKCKEITFTHNTMQLKGWRNGQTSAQISKASRIWLYYTEKDKYCIISFIGESKINKIQTHGFREQIDGCQRQGMGLGKMGEVGEGVQRYKLPVIRCWDVMYSMVTRAYNTVLYTCKLLRG